MGGSGVRINGEGLSLSIIIPTKNRPAFLQQAVQSALVGLPETAEVLVVDDRSDPAVAQFDDPRVRVVRSGAVPGASGARNWGVAQARGRRVLFLDDDDALLPGYATWISGLDGRYGFSAVSRFTGESLPRFSPFEPKGTVAPDKEVRFRRRLAGLGCGFWIDRDLFIQIGGVDEGLRVNEDTDFSIRLMRAGVPGLRSIAPGVAIRAHAPVAGRQGHLTFAFSAEERADCFGRIINRHADWLMEQDEARLFLLERRIKYLVRAGDKAGLTEALARAQGWGERIWLRAYAGLCRLSDRWRGL